MEKKASKEVSRKEMEELKSGFEKEISQLQLAFTDKANELQLQIDTLYREKAVLDKNRDFLKDQLLRSQNELDELQSAREILSLAN